MTFATRMRLIRLVHGVTQQELAARCGIPNTYLSLIESGKMTPQGDWEQRIKDVLNWTPAADAALDTLRTILVA